MAEWLTTADQERFAELKWPPLTMGAEVAFQFHLTVRVMNATDLVPLDLKISGGGGRSDPYVKATIHGCQIKEKKNHSKRTKYIMNDCNPVWNEDLTFTYIKMEPRDLKDATLELSVWDHDTVSRDDPEGSVIIPFSQIVLHGRDPSPMTLDLQDIKSGQLTVQIFFGQYRDQAFLEESLKIVDAKEVGVALLSMAKPLMCGGNKSDGSLTGIFTPTGVLVNGRPLYHKPETKTKGAMYLRWECEPFPMWFFRPENEDGGETEADWLANDGKKLAQSWRFSPCSILPEYVHTWRVVVDGAMVSGQKAGTFTVRPV